ncbi:hypothetical protein JTB14_004949 [Gonioctena quinquepunctata]|nr:hypothetical protein JTB14_004949 [Gonioctena quinquepunctata]
MGYLSNFVHIVFSATNFLVKKFFLEHFNVEKLSTLHPNPEIFIAAQWQSDKTKPNLMYLIYRTCHFAFLLGTWIPEIRKRSWYVYLTNWNYTLLTLQSLISWTTLAVDYIIFIIKKGYPSKTCSSCSYSHCIYWALSAVSNSHGFMITLLFWTILYDPSKRDYVLADIFVHGCNSIFIMLDLWITAHPVNLAHWLYSFIFGFAYAIFSVAYHFHDKSRGGTGWVYQIVDWDYPGKASAVMIGICGLTFLMTILSFSIYKVRLSIYKKIAHVDTKPQFEEPI